MSNIPDTVVVSKTSDGGRDSVKEPGVVSCIAELVTDPRTLSEAVNVSSELENSDVTLTDDETTMLDV